MQAETPAPMMAKPAVEEADGRQKVERVVLGRLSGKPDAGELQTSFEEHAQLCGRDLNIVT